MKRLFLAALTIVLAGFSFPQVAAAQSTILDPLNERRGSRDLPAFQNDPVVTPIACRWAAEVAAGATGINPELASELSDVLGDQWVRASEISATAGSIAGVWSRFDSDARYLGNATGGGYNRVGVCFEDGASETTGVVIFVADRAAPASDQPALPDEPLSSPLFTLRLIGALSALVISILVVLINWRRS